MSTNQGILQKALQWNKIEEAGYLRFERDRRYFVFGERTSMYEWISAHYIWLIIIGIMGFTILSIRYSGKKNSKWKSYIVVASGVLYLGAVLYVTLMMRMPGENYTYKTTLFWSYRQAFATGDYSLLREDLANVFLFFPLGMFLADWQEGKLRIPVCAAICFAVSLGIELLQLVFKLGLFEFDDMFHNTLGGMLGFGVAIGIQRVTERVKHTGTK
ncbi:MAG: VanZ family protein [Lachnospiraceae bacterium]|nr:VanZ family protein [Lachnospiraceae bacterium]